MQIILKFLLFLLFLYWYKNSKNVSVLLMTIFFLIDAIRVVMSNKIVNSNIIIIINIVQFLLILGALLFFIVYLKNNNKIK